MTSFKDFWDSPERKGKTTETILVIAMGLLLLGLIYNQRTLMTISFAVGAVGVTVGTRHHDQLLRGVTVHNKRFAATQGITAIRCRGCGFYVAGVVVGFFIQRQCKSGFTAGDLR